MVIDLRIRCSNCRSANYDPGFCGSREEPPEPSGWYCTHPEMQDKQENDETALFCVFYDPKIVEQCAQCGKEIGTPEYAHPYWGNSLYESNVPVCSEACRNQWNADMDDMIADEIRAEQYAERYGSTREIQD